MDVVHKISKLSCTVPVNIQLEHPSNAQHKDNPWPKTYYKHQPTPSVRRLWGWIGERARECPLTQTLSDLLCACIFHPLQLRQSIDSSVVSPVESRSVKELRNSSTSAFISWYECESSGIASVGMSGSEEGKRRRTSGLNLVYWSADETCAPVLVVLH